MNQFTGLGVFVDTYPNADRLHDVSDPASFTGSRRGRSVSPAASWQRSYPYVSVMLGNGTLSYDHDRDGRPTELGGCSALVRNAVHDTFLLVRYSGNRLRVREVPRRPQRLGKDGSCPVFCLFLTSFWLLRS